MINKRVVIFFGLMILGFGAKLGAMEDFEEINCISHVSVHAVENQTEAFFNTESYKWFIAKCSDELFIKFIICNASRNYEIEFWRSSNVPSKLFFLNTITKHNEIFNNPKIKEMVCKFIDATLKERNEAKPRQYNFDVFSFFHPEKFGRYLESLCHFYMGKSKMMSIADENVYAAFIHAEYLLEILCILCNTQLIKPLIEDVIRKSAPTSPPAAASALC